MDKEKTTVISTLYSYTVHCKESETNKFDFCAKIEIF